MHAANAACCTAPTLLAANAAGHTPQTYFFTKLPKLLQALCASTVIGLYKDPRVLFIKLSTSKTNNDLIQFNLPWSIQLGKKNDLW
jgi:hypothetical protein